MANNFRSKSQKGLNVTEDLFKRSRIAHRYLIIDDYNNSLPVYLIENNFPYITISFYTKICLLIHGLQSSAIFKVVILKVGIF